MLGTFSSLWTKEMIQNLDTCSRHGLDCFHVFMLFRCIEYSHHRLVQDFRQWRYNCYNSPHGQHNYNIRLFINYLPH
jgi:hypothetical protein